MAEVTRLLQRARKGDREALDELMPLVYGELRRIARSFMRRQQP
jgi:ECF sigma factor